MIAICAASMLLALAVRRRVNPIIKTRENGY